MSERLHPSVPALAQLNARTSGSAAESGRLSSCRCRDGVALAGAQSLNGDGCDESSWNLMGLSRAAAGAGDAVVSVLFAVVRRRDIRAPRVWLLLAAGVTAAMWAFFTVGAPVMVSISQDPQGAECLVDPFGDHPSRTVSWTSDCGHAFARHLLASGGPVLLLLGVTAGATVRSSRRSRSQSSRTPVAAS